MGCWGGDEWIGGEFGGLMGFGGRAGVWNWKWKWGNGMMVFFFFSFSDVLLDEAAQRV